MSRRIPNILIRAAVLLTAVSLCLVGCSRSVTADSQSAVSGSFVGFVAATESDADARTVSARSAILLEMTSGEVIYQKNADERLPMASTTKIMTALVALENCDVSHTVTVSPDAVGIEGSSVYLFSGESISMQDLLYALLLSSANDAAAAIAIEVGGSIEDFAAMMNQRAASLGLENTHFTNPHGLYDEQHYTTARELAVIANEAMKHPTFARIVATYKWTSQMAFGNAERLFVNHNKLLLRYEGACGIKTGYTKRSGRCLVSCAERDGTRLLCVTLDAPDDWRDHSSLFDYGFSLYETRTLCEVGELDYSLPLIGGEQDHVSLTNSAPVQVTLPRGAKPEITLEVPRFVFAEVTEGQILGYAVYKLDGREIARVPLCARYGISRKIYKKGILGAIFG